MRSAMPSVMLSSDGSFGARELNYERESNHYGPGAGGKKRKVPAFAHSSGGQDFDISTYQESMRPLAQRYRNYPCRAPAQKVCLLRKDLFLRRKAALITLYLDAQTAVLKGNARVATLPDVPTFERLIPALEDLGVTEWEPDQPGWRKNCIENPQRSQVLEHWKRPYETRRLKTLKTPVVREGWAPEGSFEFEMDSKASAALRARAKDQAMLHKLATDLRAVALSANIPQVPHDNLSGTDTTPSTPEHPATPLSQDLGVTKSSKKKKKRSVKANLGNPHHVVNYRPSRTLSPHTDTNLHLSSLRLLMRNTSSEQSQPVAITEDDYICCFCEMQLFYGSESTRRQAIRRLKKEQKRREIILTKAKSVAEGKGSHEEDLTDHEDGDSCGEEGYGRCTCGRAIAEPHGPTKSRIKPPQTDPPLNGENF